MAGHRHEHLNHLLLQKLSLLLNRELDDPQLMGVTITSVRLSKDHDAAHVNFSCFVAGADVADQERRLNAHAGRLSHALARSWPTRKTPKLRFHHDPGPDRLQEMENLLKTVRPEGGFREDGATEESGEE